MTDGLWFLACIWAPITYFILEHMQAFLSQSFLLRIPLSFFPSSLEHKPALSVSQGREHILKRLACGHMGTHILCIG